MKLLIILTMIAAMATCFKPINAGELSLSLTQKALDGTDDVFGTDLWVGAQVSYQPDNSDWYYFASKEVVEVSLIYKAFEYDMTGFGVGTKFKLTPNISLFGQVGYYIVKNSWGDRKREDNEALLYYINRRFDGFQRNFDSYLFKDYSVKNDNALGWTVGIEMMRPINKNWKAGFVASYRMMKIHEEINGYAYDGERGWWQAIADRNYTSKNAGFIVTYAF